MGTITAKDVTITAIMPNGERITIDPYDTSSDSTNIAIDMIVRNNFYLRKQRDQLAEALRVMTELCAIKYGNLDADVWAEIEKARAALAAIEEE